MLNREVAIVAIEGLEEHGDTQRFAYQDNFGQPAQGVLLRFRGKLVAFRDLCPHWAVSLGFAKGESALDAGGIEVLCRTHGARFDPESGYCLEGPCLGDRLETFDVELSEDGARAHIRRRMLKLSF